MRFWYSHQYHNWGCWWSTMHFQCQNSLVVFLGQTPRNDFMAKYSSESVSMIEVLGNLKVFGTFHLSSIGELVGYNEKFQPQKVVVEVVREVVGDSSRAWTFLGFFFHRDILYFVCSSVFLYVDRSLLHIVRPHL